MSQIHQHECIECGDSYDCEDESCEVDSLGNGQPDYCPDCDPDGDDFDNDDGDDFEEIDNYE